ncbi:hypothetical protein LTR27_010639 [Elasticomyces elasticus]|nr:hypothetical protein LTR27_010639 [Elasticomyces elasticus]
MLAAHLEWNYDEPSEFSSWSVSLLWVLVHAVSKTTTLKGTRRQAESPAEILIYVLDTKAIAENRIYRSKDLVRTFDLNHIDFIEDYCQGEYLVHGRLQHTDGFKAVTLAELIFAGLYVRYPGLRLDTGKYKVHVRSRRLRGEYSDQIWSLRSRVTPNYRFLGRCFGQEWEAVMTLAFISVRARDTDTKASRAILLEDLDGLPIPRGMLAAGSAVIDPTRPDDGIHEADQLAEWLSLLRKRRLRHQKRKQQKAEDDKDVADMLSGLTCDPQIRASLRVAIALANAYGRAASEAQFTNRGLTHDDRDTGPVYDLVSVVWAGPA